MIAYLVSAATGYVNGQTLVMDGRFLSWQHGSRS